MPYEPDEVVAELMRNVGVWVRDELDPLVQRRHLELVHRVQHSAVVARSLLSPSESLLCDSATVTH